MEEKMMQVRNDHPRRSQKRRRKRFPWGDIVATLLVVAICVYVFMSFGEKTTDEETPVRGTSAPTTTQAQDNVQVGILAESTQPTLSDIDWNLVLVNHENAIPENYEINLVEVAGGEKVDERIYDPLMEMLEAAKEGNWDQLPMVVSGYRTQAKQQKLFDDKVAKYQSEGYSKSEAEEMAKQWVAVPGYSEHQIGLAVDINGATYDLYFWLQENSYKYGFIFRYPGYGLVSGIPILSTFYNGIFHVFDYTRNGLFYVPMFLLLGAAGIVFSRRTSVIGLLCSLAALIVEALLLHRSGIQRHDSMYFFFPFLMIFLFSLLLEANQGERRSLRQLTTVVYLIHPWCLVLVRGAAKIVGLTDLLVENTVVLFILVLVSSFLLSQMLLLLQPPRPVQTGRAWIELDRAALRHNVKQLQSILPEGCALMPAVKANAYGHGAVLIAKELNRLGIMAFCVATVTEGAELRRGGIKGEILVLGYTHPEQFYMLRRYRLTQTVVDISYGMDVKTLSAIIGHVSSATTLNVYAHVTDGMRQSAAAKIDCAIAKAEPQAEPATRKKPARTTFQAVKGKYRKPGTGCVSQISDQLWEGRYSPKVNGKRMARNVYAHSEGECEEKLAKLIEEMKEELTALRTQARAG